MRLGDPHSDYPPLWLVALAWFGSLGLIVVALILLAVWTS